MRRARRRDKEEIRKEMEKIEQRLRKEIGTTRTSEGKEMGDGRECRRTGRGKRMGARGRKARNENKGGGKVEEGTEKGRKETEYSYQRNG